MARATPFPPPSGLPQIYMDTDKATFVINMDKKLQKLLTQKVQLKHEKTQK